MKNIFLLLSFLLLQAACDKVSNPIEKAAVAKGKDFIVKTNESSGDTKKVLLEDYTGHQCGNCPRAAIVADSLSKKFAGRVIVIAVHAGGFALTNSNYPTSYTITAGEEWDDYFGVPGYPNGMVDRRLFAGLNTPVHDDRKWVSTVPVALEDANMLRLDLKTLYDPVARALNAEIKATFKTAYAKNVSLITALMEDSIIGPQFNYAASPPKVKEYVFNHMLRATLRGTWGDVLKAAPIAVNDTARLNYNDFYVDPKFNDRQLTLVAFAYNSATREVIQVEKVKIR